MAKTYGGLRAVSTVQEGSFDMYAAQFRAELATGKYDITKSYLVDTGAYVLFENEYNYNEEEIEAARAMAEVK